MRELSYYEIRSSSKWCWMFRRGSFR